MLHGYVKSNFNAEIKLEACGEFVSIATFDEVVTCFGILCNSDSVSRLRLLARSYQSPGKICANASEEFTGNSKLKSS